MESTRGNFCLFDDGASRMCLRNVPVSCGLCLFVMRGAFNWKKLRLRARYGAVRAWKLLLLLPRMLRPTRGGLVRREIDGFLDDIYAVCTPDPVGAVFVIVEQEMQARAHVRMHHGKTQVWNQDEWCQMALKSSLPQPGLVKPEPVVWRGDTELPLSEQGVKVLGVPIGQPACVQLFLAKIGRSKTLCSNVSRGARPTSGIS